MTHPVEYRVGGMDCPACAAKIEQAVRAIDGVSAVRVSIASQLMTLDADVDAAVLARVEQCVEDLGYHLGTGTDAAAHTPGAGYRRALWIVVALNLGFGVIEMAGGVLAGSQALKADALDFVGDGLITFLGVLALGWPLVWRARSALLQGVFLGLLGIGVMVSTAYRVLVARQPDPEVMGLLGAAALVVNVAAAAVLIPHRSGDANVRAVWLFSRNDAIGNIAVIVAAGAVALTRHPWPDLAVAVVIAALFLHSSWSIIRDARTDLRA